MTDQNPPYFQNEMSPYLAPPEGWTWKEFAREDRHFRYGSVCPKTEPEAIVIGLQGLSEFCEKYYETAQDMLDRNLAFTMMDWAGQGKSTRFLKNPHKRHATSFEDDLADLDMFIKEHVIPLQAAYKSTPPLIFLGHSMGAHIGLRYLARHPDTIKCAIFSAPMIGIEAIRLMPAWFQKLLSSFLNMTGRNIYVWGGGNWDQAVRQNADHNPFSHDPIRHKIHNEWCLHDPALQVGNITFGWIYEAIKSCHALQTELSMIKTPCVLAAAEYESIVDNHAIKKSVHIIPHSELLEIPDAQHEILVETDAARNLFLEAFDKLRNS